MIYSDAFSALPDAAKSLVYRRLWLVLAGQDKDKKYARLSPADRRAIIEILRDTKKDLPDYFQ
jgi:MinD-like ATPase involved in chromosome partitioning or flagellar assembly